MTLKQATEILKKYQIDVDLTEDPYYSSMEVYTQIRHRNINLLDAEEILLFDAFWELGNIKRNKNTPISSKLKIRLLRTIGKRKNFYLFAIGEIGSVELQYYLKEFDLPTEEESELWYIFQQNDEEEESVSRTSDQVDNILGLYKIIDSKVKWFGKIKILDVGCGKRGIAISTLVNKYPKKIKGYGIDIAIAEHPSNVRIIKGDVRNLPFRYNTFDVIYSGNVIYYIKNTEIVSVIKEILRVLKPKGILVFDDSSRSVSKYEAEIIPRIDIKAKVLKGYTTRSKIIVKH